MFTVIMIRDFPDFPIGWSGSYVLCSLPKFQNAQKRAIEEVKMRGGKYGAVLFDGKDEILTIPRQ